MSENEPFLSEQIITYLGNKRSLLDFIARAVECVIKETGKDKLEIFDVFAGSGIVSRFFKQYSNVLYTNDMEDYCYTINNCYLKNKSDFDENELNHWFLLLKDRMQGNLVENGFIAKLYAPKNDKNIKHGERVFYTTRNAQYLDTARQFLELVPEPYKTLLLGPLLYKASVKNNTSGVFKGFYKNSNTHIGQYGGNGQNALGRILAPIEVKLPVLSSNNCEVHIFKGDSNEVCLNVPHIDLAYLDPPYNQHPYSSNYFMLNLLNQYVEPVDISDVSGIPSGWNKSSYNKKNLALNSMQQLCERINAKYILVSYNSEGFISYEDMINMLSKYGNVRVFDKEYNVFRACRNLNNRDIHVKEYLFLLKKEG